jgi:hypothetical protein
VVGVGQAVGASLGSADHRALGEGEHCAGRAGKGQKLGNWLSALGVGDGVAAAILDGQSDALGFRNIRQELGSGAVLGTDLEVTNRNASAA